MVLADKQVLGSNKVQFMDLYVLVSAHLKLLSVTMISMVARIAIWNI